MFRTNRALAVLVSLQPINTEYSCDADAQYDQRTRRVIRNESVPIQLAQCWFPELAIFSAKIYIYFSN